jgi:hypothetical protein
MEEIHVIFSTNMPGDTVERIGKTKKKLLYESQRPVAVRTSQERKRSM